MFFQGDVLVTYQFPKTPDLKGGDSDRPKPTPHTTGPRRFSARPDKAHLFPANPMKPALTLSFACLLFLSHPAVASDTKLSLSASTEGVVIDAGSMGKITLPVPGLRMGPTDYKGEKPSVELEGTEKIVARYPSGGEFTMDLSAGNGTIACSFSGVPANAIGFTFATKIPINFNQGGKFSIGSGALQAFPETFDKQIIAQGTAKQFNLLDAMGDGFSIKTPADYQQVQDNRAFNWPVFMYILNFTFATNPGKSSFLLQVGSFEGSTESAKTNSDEPRKFLVDRYGQSAKKDFTGKVTRDEELKADAAKEALALAAFVPLGDQDIYGGLAGRGEQLNLRKTGFFHVQKVGDRQILVTPEGNAFFHLGVCGISSTDDHTLVKGREKIFEWLPEPTGEFATAWRDGKPSMGIMSFFVANWIRKFNKPFTLEDWTAQVVPRLKMWGFNSAGAFSANTETMRSRNFPGVSFLPLGKRDAIPVLPENLGAAELMDPFAPGVEAALETAFAKKVAPRANDPLLIGYFLGNEQHLENLPKVIPRLKASQSPAKAKLVEMLQKKYNAIEQFNLAWEPAHPFASFEALKDEPLFVRNDTAAADMRKFYRLYLEAYYSLVEKTFRKFDPNHLLIGSRWTPHTANNEDVVRIASKHLDVISINYYTYAIEESFLKKVNEWSGGKPLILSEWYFSSSDRGLGSPKEVADQKERGAAYRNYVEQSAALPFVVGVEWFIYTDQAISGRFFQGFNGEGNNTGLVDVTDRPYEELVAACRETNARIYDVMLGKEKPYAFENPRFNSKAGAQAGKMIAIPRALPGIQIDGTTSNWPGVPGEPIEASRQMVGKANPDLRGDFRLCWDDTNLYFLIQVKDPTPLKNLRDDKGMWGADGVELFIGSREISTAGTMIFSDRQILIGASEPARIHIVDHAEESKMCQVLAVKDVTGDGYVLEAKIPWKALGVEAKPNMEFLFDVALDYSDDGKARSAQLVWNGTSDNSGDRGLWGKARIVEN